MGEKKEAESRRSWIFQYNPQEGEQILDDILKDGLNEREDEEDRNEMGFSVNRYLEEYSIGDRVYLWKSGEKRGIYAQAIIYSAPWTGTAIVGSKSRFTKFITIKFDHEIKDYPVLADEMKSNNILKEMLIMRNAQGTNFKLSEAEAGEIKKLYKQHIQYILKNF